MERSRIGEGMGLDDLRSRVEREFDAEALFYHEEKLTILDLDDVLAACGEHILADPYGLDNTIALFKKMRDAAVELKRVNPQGFDMIRKRSLARAALRGSN